MFKNIYYFILCQTLSICFEFNTILTEFIAKNIFKEIMGFLRSATLIIRYKFFKPLIVDLHRICREFEFIKVLYNKMDK